MARVRGCCGTMPHLRAKPEMSLALASSLPGTDGEMNGRAMAIHSLKMLCEHGEEGRDHRLVLRPFPGYAILRGSC